MAEIGFIELYVSKRILINVFPIYPMPFRDTLGDYTGDEDDN
jgi:hypothetical protein